MSEFVECPVVDLERIYRPNATYEDYRSLGKELVKLLQEIGFLYFINHGFDEELLDRLHSSAREFYAMDHEVKMKYVSDNAFRGYTPLNSKIVTEKLLSTDSSEETPLISEAFREAYSSDAKEVKDGGLPEIVEVPAFRESFSEFIRRCKTLAFKLFKAFEMGLEIPEGTLKNLHQATLADDDSKTSTFGRSFNYPPFKKEIKDGTVIYAEHSDLDAFTLLSQDDVGGLEVLNKNNIWQPVTPKKNAIVFNTGSSFEIWTAGRIVGTPHRVVVAANTGSRKVSRRSFAYFTCPDNEAVLKPLIQSAENEKYRPISFSDHFIQRLKGYLTNDITATP